MKYLWDTCVVSDLGKSDREPLVVRYLDSIPTDETDISAITVGEIEYGISRLPFGRRRRGIEEIMHQILEEFEPRILPIDADVARVWGQLSAKVRNDGFEIEVADGLIAATALYHGMHVVTRNVKDFEPTGVLVVNPWDEAGSDEG